VTVVTRGSGARHLKTTVDGTNRARVFKEKHHVCSSELTDDPSGGCGGDVYGCWRVVRIGSNDAANRGVLCHDRGGGDELFRLDAPSL
jgi:hypothetical protein